MALSYRLSVDDNHDGMNYFYGVRIKGGWYFFKGPNIFLPRQYYQKDVHKPLSFSKLHEIAMQEIFNGYLIQNAKSIWEINDRFFSDFTSGAWYRWKRPNTQAQWDSVYLIIANNVWKYGKKDIEKPIQ